MIRRLYVDNYRSLVDFNWEPAAEVLVLGLNGSGKTATLDAIDVIRSWAWGWTRVEDMFDADALTRWRDVEIVRFEMDVEVSGQLYRYKVEFDCSGRDKVPRLRTESLRIDGDTVFVRNLEAVTYHGGQRKPPLHFPLPTNQSAVASLFAGEGSKEAGPFLTALSQMVVVRPMPHRMTNEAKKPDQRPDFWFQNFVAWYWYQAATGKFPTIMLKLLSSVWPEFDYLKLEPLGRAMALSVVFKPVDSIRSELPIEFHELSDGERMLIMLYALAAYQSASPPTTLIIDEPDNFVAMAELQPWLLQMLDDRPNAGQLILVSHNPEIANTMGLERVVYFERADHLSPTNLLTLVPDESGLSLSERLTRGWIPEEEAKKTHA